MPSSHEAAARMPESRVVRCAIYTRKSTEEGLNQEFNTLEANLKIRTAPATTASIAGYLGGIGSKVRIDCYLKGTPVFDDPVWYHTDSPATGYVTGRLLNTGGDPLPGVPRC